MRPLIKVEPTVGVQALPPYSGPKARITVVDFEIKANFSWDVNESYLATRWDIHSLYDKQRTIICYGAVDTCNFVDLSPTMPYWNEAFYLYYGRYGATLNNTVSAQVIYANYSLDEEDLYSDIVYSDWSTLPAIFLNDSTIENISNISINNLPICDINDLIIIKVYVSNNLSLLLRNKLRGFPRKGKKK